MSHIWHFRKGWYKLLLLGALTHHYPTNLSNKGWYNNEFSVWPCTKTVSSRLLLVPLRYGPSAPPQHHISWNLEALNYIQSDKVDLSQNQLSTSSHHPQLNCEVWKWYHVHNVLYTECQSLPWPLTPWPKTNRVPLLIIPNLRVNFERDWAKTLVPTVSTRSYTQSARIDLDLWPRDPKSRGFLFSSFTTNMWSLKWLDKNCLRYHVHKVLYTDSHSWPWPLTPWPKIKRVPPIIIIN